jgi:hypothetical protein
MVQLHLRFRSRRAGSFGSSPVGKVFEWLTATWLRFSCLMLCIIISLIAVFSDLPAGQQLAMILLSPIGGIFYWYVFLFLLLVSEYMGTFGIVLSRVLIIYFYLFSRLIVQRPPPVSLPLTRR